MSQKDLSPYSDPEGVSPVRGDGLRRARAALAPRRSRSQAVVFLLCLLLGVSIIAQVQGGDDDLSSLSEENLVRLLDESELATERLEGESRALEEEIERLEADQADEQAARDAAAERLAELRIVAGTVPAEGEGIMITIADPNGALQPSTLLSLLQELRNAGAEVIQIGDARVVASTWIGGEAGALVVDGEPLAGTFTVRAIGDPAVLEPAMMIPGGAEDAVVADGAALSIDGSGTILITAVRQPETPEHAQVVK